MFRKVPIFSPFDFRPHQGCADDSGVGVTVFYFFQHDLIGILKEGRVFPEETAALRIPDGHTVSEIIEANVDENKVR